MKNYSQLFMPVLSLGGEEALVNSIPEISSYQPKKTLIVTDQNMIDIGVVSSIQTLFDNNEITYSIFSSVHPNPRDTDVEAGLKQLENNQCDFILSVGGGSHHDCAKAIGIVASNGGKIHDYEGLNKLEKPPLPIVSINTTSGTAAEMTRFCIITDTTRKVKMAIVDHRVTPLFNINDPSLTVTMPKDLTAYTGMDALTHAIEAYVSTCSFHLTDTFALDAISIIFKHLRDAVNNPNDIQARTQMSTAQFLAGMAFNSAGLGYVHAMSHQLGGFYDLPHGMCNAMLLPHVENYNKDYVPEKFIPIANAAGIDFKDHDKPLCIAKKVIESIFKLSKDVNIPIHLSDIGVLEQDLPVLAENTLKDVCGFTNPRQASKEDIINIFKKAL